MDINNKGVMIIYNIIFKKKIKVLPGLEPGLKESESFVITTTLQDQS